MRLLFVALATVVLLYPAAAQGRRHHGRCDHHCLIRSRHHYQKRVIAPYRGWLASTGHCESARYPGGYSLRAGLTAISPGGAYRGRYQFDFDSWERAGGYGDPAAASWLEQAYRAVRWRQMVGTGAWPVCG